MALEFVAWVVANKKVLLASLKFGKRALKRATAIEQAEARTILEIQKAREHIAQPGADVMSSFAETESALNELLTNLDNPARISEILTDLWAKPQPKCIGEELAQAYKMIPSLYYAPHTQFDAVRAVKTADNLIENTHGAFLGMFKMRYQELKTIDPLPDWNGALPQEIDCERYPKNANQSTGARSENTLRQYIEAYQDLLEKYKEAVRALISE